MAPARHETRGSALREQRLRRGLSVAAAAALLGVPPGNVRALEWDRADLLDANAVADLLDEYVALLATGRAPARPATAPRPGVLRALVEPVGFGVALVALAVAGVTAAEVVSSGGPRPTFAPALGPASSQRAETTADLREQRPEAAPSLPTVATDGSGSSSTARAPTVAPPPSRPRTTSSTSRARQRPERPEPERPEPQRQRPERQEPERPTSAATTSSSTRTGAPGRVVGVVASRSGGRITIAWHTSARVDEIRVYRRAGGGRERLLYRGRGARFVDAAAPRGREYRYRIVGIAGRRTSSVSVVVRPS